MVRYVHVIGRQHGVATSSADDEIRRLEETIEKSLPESSKWHGKYYHQDRKRTHPSWLRKELIFAVGGYKGLKRLEEIWYHTWVLVINLDIEGNFYEDLLRTLRGLEMTVGSMEYTDGMGLDTVTKRMLQLRDEIPWLEDGRAKKDMAKACRYFGNRFNIGRHI